MKKYLPYVMGLAYVVAGCNHFWDPQFYIKMIDNFLPMAAKLVVISGVAEVALGMGMLFPETRRYAAMGIIALLIAVFPANINMAIHHANWNLPPTALYLRLPVQLLLIYWAYLYAKTKHLES